MSICHGYSGITFEKVQLRLKPLKLPLGPTTMASPRNPHDEGIVMYETHHSAPPQAPSAAHLSSSLSPSVYRWLRPINNSRNLVKG